MQTKKVNGFVVEDNIPIPIGGSRAMGSPELTVMRTMKVGQSILLPLKNAQDASNRARSAWGRGCFKVRREGAKYRVWRTA